MISRSTTRLTTARRCCRNRRSTSWDWLRSATVNSRSTWSADGVTTWVEVTGPPAPLASWSGSTESGIADPRVEYAVEQVGDQVQDDDEGRGDQQPGFERVDVVAPDGIEQERARALPLEHGLGDHRSTEDRADVQRGDRGQRDERVAQRVPSRDGPARHTFRARQPDVVAAHHLEHRRALETAPSRVGRQRERDRRQDHMAEGVAQMGAESSGHRDRTLTDRVEDLIAHAFVDGDADLLQQDREPESGQRQKKETKEGSGVVEFRVLPDGAHDTDDHGQDQSDQHRECDQPDGHAEPGDHLRADVDPRHDRRPEVAAEDPDDPVPVPGEEGLVEVQAYAL